MQKGKIGVTSENIFPIIKKFLYSEHDIFLRELISNAVDATQKMKALSSAGDFKGEVGDTTIIVKADKDKGTLTISDKGIGMTAEEIDKYINQIAFSSAEEFLTKYKDKIDAIIGHFGLGFYSAFMVSKKVEIHTKSWQSEAKAMKWECEGNPDYFVEEIEKAERGTDIILYLDDESKEYLEENRIQDLLKKYCKFLPVEIGFGTEKEWIDEKWVETGKAKIINNTKPAWTRKPSELTEEDYKNFYKELYPTSHEDPLFYIHLNVDYPFKLTGILYFPKIKNYIEVQKNKIQLYCNQVYVTDTVEGIVPEFLTLLHGVIDSPDIPLNVSRSYLQGDPNVKKISSHITKKVADRLADIFKNQREEFEKKWDDLKIFMQYGMVSDEKFYEKASTFALLKNTDKKYFTFEEYETLIKENQTDKEKKTVILYTTDMESQYSFIDAAKSKAYDVLIMDGHLDTHFIQNVEQKKPDFKFMRVDSDTIDNLIKKDDKKSTKLSKEEQSLLTPVFESQCPQKIGNFTIVYEDMQATDLPIMITQSEFMRRMKDMAKMGTYGFYYEMPNNFNLVVNSNHPLVYQVQNDLNSAMSSSVSEIDKEITPIQTDIEALEALKKGKNYDEVPQEEKDKMEQLLEKKRELEDKKDKMLTDWGKDNKLVKQMIDLALLANNLLKGEDLTKFVKRSVEFIEK